MKGVGGIILSHDYFVFLIKLRPSGNFDLWSHPSGRLNIGEDANSALERIVHETTGTSLKSLKYICDYERYRKGKLQYISSAYLIQVSSEPQRTDTKHVSEMAYYSPCSLPGNISSETKYFIDVLKKEGIIKKSIE